MRVGERWSCKRNGRSLNGPIHRYLDYRKRSESMHERVNLGAIGPEKDEKESVGGMTGCRYKRTSERNYT